MYRQIDPRVGHYNTGLNAGVLPEQVKEVSAIKKFERFALGEFKGSLTITATVVTRMPLEAPSFWQVPNKSRTALTPTVFL